MQTRKRVIETATAEPTVSDTISKSLKSNSDWSDKDEFLDVLYWMRQIIGVICGLTWGIIPLKGFVGLVLFFALSTLIIYLYANSFQRINEEDMGGYSEILKEGLMTSFATFLISWIILYSALYH